MNNDWLIKGARVIDPANGLDAVRDLLIQGGKVAGIGESLSCEDIPTIDAAGLTVTPGFVDLHCHLREPGFEYKETIATGARAAVRGGFTTVCSMANTDPVTDNPATVAYHPGTSATGRRRARFPIGSSHAELWRHATRRNGGAGRGRRRSFLRRRRARSRATHHAPRAGVQLARKQAYR